MQCLIHHELSFSNRLLHFVSRNNERKDLILSKLFILLTHESNDDGIFRDWIMYFLGIVQSNFNQGESTSTTKDSVFSLDVFVFCIVVSTGCVAFVDNEINMENRAQWINTFPEALFLLSNRSEWGIHMPRVSAQTP